MNNNKILISTSSFAKFDKCPLNLLKDKGFEIILNPFGRELTAQEVIDLGINCSGFIAGTEPLRADTLTKLKNLKVISRCGAGLDNVDIVRAGELKIKVFNTPDSPTVAVAELTIGLIFSLLRKVVLMDKELRSGKWSKRMGSLLEGKSVGIIGMGRIGKKVAQYLQPFGVQVYFSDPNIQETSIGYALRLELDKLLEAVDIVTIHMSFNQRDRYLIDSAKISLMKPGAFLVNCSRGGIVDENALYLAVKEGKLAGAAIDVFEKEPYSGKLIELENVILTPHIGSYAVEARIGMEKESVYNLLKGFGIS